MSPKKSVACFANQLKAKKKTVIKSSKQAPEEPACKQITSKAKPRPTSEWLSSPEKKCMSCEQTTWELDHDSPTGEEMYLKLHAKRVLKDGSIVAGGDECHYCYMALQ